MSDKENRRTCFKCGCSPAADNVKLFRFPKPAVRNLLRCELWAKYIFPDREPTLELQRKLHSEHRMLCQKHFQNDDFTDDTKKLLVRNAVPSDNETVVPHLNIPSMEPEAGSSQRIQFMDISNISITTPVLNTTSNPVMQPLTAESKICEVKENNLYAKLSKYMRKTFQLEQRIKNLKRNQMLKALEEEQCVKKLSQKLTPAFALLLQSQIRNHKKKLTGRRWSKDDKITALRIYKRSPTCYRLLRRLFHLPSPSTLKLLLNKLPFCVGVNQSIFEVLKQHVKAQKPADNNYVLIFDEMSLKKHLNYNNRDDWIEGYQDHGDQGRSPNIAAYALVFMIAGIRKRVKQPIAHYFSSGFSTADRLAVLIKEVLHQCFRSGINIAAIVCDMDGVNRRALAILGATSQYPCITLHGKKIQTLFDPPHLLECFRNLFLKYDIECSTNISTVDNRIGKGIAKWSHIKELFEVDSQNPNFVYATSLKKEHLNPNNKQKMKVNLAAQVFSHSVTGGMYSKIGRGEISTEAIVTADLVNDVDKLFDALNSDQSDLRRGKPYATNLTASSPHLQHFEKMKTFFTNMKYIGCPRKPPSQDGWIWTLNAVEGLWKELVAKHNVTSLATRRLQQDPIENLFGCVRGNCGSNTNPTTGQFVAGLKTAILNNLARLGTTGNCETDNNVVIDNLQTLLSVSTPQPTHEIAESHLDFHSVQLPDLNDIINDNSADFQACAYVCGFIAKNLKSDCEVCKNIFMSVDVESHHSFVECREYTENKKSLTYVTKDLVLCVESCATLINEFLNQKGHVNNLKNNIFTNIEINVNFDFLNQCTQHKEMNRIKIMNNVFHICVKRFCTLKNRKFSEETSASSLKRKMDIILHK